jgi:hypothetical protein
LGRAKSKKIKDFMRGLDYKKRLELKEQKKEAKRIIYENAFNDHEKREIVSKSSCEDVLSKLSLKFSEVQVCAVPVIEKGLVLSNDYGQGAFQDPAWWR